MTEQLVGGHEKATATPTGNEQMGDCLIAGLIELAQDLARDSAIDDSARA